MDIGKRIERWLKRRLFGLIMGRVSRESNQETVDLPSVRRVLLVRANTRLGNLLLVTPAIAALRHALPRARVDVLCDAAYGCLLAADPAVNDVVPINRRIMRNPIALARLVRRLRSTHYDLVIECARGGSFLGALLTYLSGGRRRVGSAGARYARFFNVQVPRAQRTHKVDLLLDLLAGIGVSSAGSVLSMVLTDAERAEATRRWASWGVAPGRPVIGVNLGGRGRKQWPIERCLDLTRRLALIAGAHVALFGGPEESALRERVTRSCLPEHAVMVPQLSVREFAALLEGCTVVVTADTGPMHLAAAVHTPTIVIARNAAAADYAPRTDRNRVVFAPDVERVLFAVMEALGEDSRST